MKVNFLHPRDSSTFPAEVDPETTGQTCLAGLIDSKFLSKAPRGRPYSLVITRTQVQVLAQSTMLQSGVQDNDSLAVQQMEQGAS